MPFPSLFETQLPLYFTEKANGSLRLEPDETIYTLWIGTNDVGASALLTGHQTPGVTLVARRVDKEGGDTKRYTAFKLVALICLTP